ncbi:trypco2 family protein [Streptomyces sp. SID10815]|uniref:Trypsin-co-occurring domain-containing protein n=1 Tax=Streptomyces similanensis TaxID=1274988 RepID=A0ABP9L395_9ACTN|nr:trypco2 family protein [Streptomyces sp. SID10815]
MEITGSAGGIELAAAVQAVRDELLRAAAQGAGSDMVFQVGPIQLEFTVELRADARVRGGIKAFVVSGEADAGAGRTRTHRVALTLEPRRATGDPLLISGEGEADASGLAAAGPL